MYQSFSFYITLIKEKEKLFPLYLHFNMNPLPKVGSYTVPLVLYGYLLIENPFFCCWS